MSQGVDTARIGGFCANLAAVEAPEIWKRLAAKEPAKGIGAIAVGKQWGWFETWLNRVRDACQQHPDQYQTKPAAGGGNENAPTALNASEQATQ